ncbi:MAG TPA: winged helix-turn-helix domain-containing protein [Xanthobacteraceae bacterium]|nr:winged helix-turn-helix domain-containing protein [Xanthobacteraceae bacterium]
MRYLFEDYALDSDRRELVRGAKPIAVEPQVFDLLHYLIRNRDHVVSKDELFASVWNGRVVSESALSTRVNAARLAVGDSGAAQRLIRTFPRRGLRFVGEVREEPDTQGRAAAEVASSAADRASIAVLPFANLGSDPDQDYFTDGIVEDIITALSRNRALFVIARNSSFTYKGKVADIKQVGRELGVRYVLEGSVRTRGGRVRVTGQLIEAATGRHLWAEKFDAETADIFALQDQIVSRVVGAIAPRLEQAEIDRAKQRSTDDLAAYDLYLRGLASWNRWTKEENVKALELFYAAIEKDPDYSTPYGLAVSCYLLGKASGWRASVDEQEVARLIDRAAEIGLDDPVALCWAGHGLAFFFKNVERGLLLIDRALELDENLAVAWQRSGWVRAYAGDPDGAIDSLHRAMRLDPLDPRMFLAQSAMGFAHFIAGRDDQAAEWAAMALRTKPNWPPALRVAIASNAMRGRRQDAEQALKLLLRVDPTMNVAKVCGFYPLRRAADRRRLVLALRKAGMPE